MEQMTTEKYLLVIKTFKKINGSSTTTVREFRAKLGSNIAPNKSSVQRLIKKFGISGFVLTLKKMGGCVLFELMNTTL